MGWCFFKFFEIYTFLSVRERAAAQYKFLFSQPPVFRALRTLHATFDKCVLNFNRITVRLKKIVQLMANYSTYG
ncbi:hypothetical protein QCBJ_26640 [Pseudomonas sp. QC2]|nr:hypothetical protein QCBJ_26640 [Pseudomonas sp. QC2]